MVYMHEASYPVAQGPSTSPAWRLRRTVSSEAKREALDRLPAGGRLILWPMRSGGRTSALVILDGANLLDTDGGFGSTRRVTPSRRGFTGGRSPERTDRRPCLSSTVYSTGGIVVIS
jgi:hypothetical protein